MCASRLVDIMFTRKVSQRGAKTMGFDPSLRELCIESLLVHRVSEPILKVI
jgi:hypothetical protein